jgi:hypothetical protein
LKNAICFSLQGKKIWSTVKKRRAKWKGQHERKVLAGGLLQQAAGRMEQIARTACNLLDSTTPLSLPGDALRKHGSHHREFRLGLSLRRVAMSMMKLCSMPPLRLFLIGEIGDCIGELLGD